MSRKVESRILASAHLSALPVYQRLVDILTSLDSSKEPVSLFTRWGSVAPNIPFNVANQAAGQDQGGGSGFSLCQHSTGSL